MMRMDKVYVNVERYGNTRPRRSRSRSTKLSAVADSTGHEVMFCAFGAGFTWASLVVQW